VTISVSSGFDVNERRPNSIFYVLNADTRQAVWASYDAQPDEWTSQFFSGDVQRGDLNQYLPSRYNGFLKHPAPTIALDAPRIVLLDDNTQGDMRTVHLNIASQQAAFTLFANVDTKAEILGTSVNGQAITNRATLEQMKAGQRWSLQYTAPPPEGVDVVFQVRPAQPLRISVVGQSYGLPEIDGVAFRPRPDDTMPTPYTNSDSTFVSKVFTF